MSFARHWIWVVLGVSIQAFGQSAPLSPEDGSLRIRKWYFSDQNLHFQNKSIWQKIEKIAKQHDFELVKIFNEYEWAQDILLFDLRGHFVEPARYPNWRFIDASYYDGLSRGIYDEESGVRKSNPEQFFSSRTLKYSYPEGGALISGFFKDSQPYLLTDLSLLQRAQLFIQKEQNRSLSLDEVKVQVAQDFGVKPEHLYPLRIKGHLDLEILALPGGKILLSDPQLTAKVVEKLIRRARGEERRRLQSMYDLYTRGGTISTSKDSAESLTQKSMQDNQLPYHPYEIELLNEVESQLSKDFTVVRVAGEFLEKNPSMGHSYLENINFFNGLHGKDSQGRYFQLTNSAKGLPLLEEYWKTLIQKELGDSSAAIYFPGIFNNGAGLDCSGAVSVE